MLEYIIVGEGGQVYSDWWDGWGAGSSPLDVWSMHISATPGQTYYIICEPSDKDRPFAVTGRESELSDYLNSRLSNPSESEASTDSSTKPEESVSADPRTPPDESEVATTPSENTPGETLAKGTTSSSKEITKTGEENRVGVAAIALVLLMAGALIVVSVYRKRVGTGTK